MDNGSTSQRGSTYKISMVGSIFEDTYSGILMGAARKGSKSCRRLECRKPRPNSAPRLSDLHGWYGSLPSGTYNLQPLLRQGLRGRSYSIYADLELLAV